MDKVIKYLICFFVGFLLARMIGNGFSVGVPSASCTTKLKEECSDKKKISTRECDACIAAHQHDLRVAGCSPIEVEQWCASPTPPPSPRSSPIYITQTQMDKDSLKLIATLEDGGDVNILGERGLNLFLKYYDKKNNKVTSYDCINDSLYYGCEFNISSNPPNV